MSLKKRVLRIILTIALIAGILHALSVPALAADHTHHFPTMAVGYAQPNYTFSLSFTNANNNVFTAVFTGRDANAFTVTPAQRTLNGSGSFQITVRPVSGLGAGHYTATLVMNVPGAPNPRHTLDVHFTVLNVFNVNFVDWDGRVISTQSVTQGSNATAPANPTRDGHTFIGWDRAFTNVQGNLTVTAQYRINTYTVSFVDWNGTVLATRTVNHGSDATAPAAPARPGYTFTGWDVPFNNITADLTVAAQYRVNSYTVKFLDYDGTTLDTQTIEHGSAATAPSDPLRDGYIFLGWFIGDELFDFDTPITEDIVLNAVWEEEEEDDAVPITFLRIADERGLPMPALLTMARNSTQSFGVAVNENAKAEGIVWTVSNTNLAEVSADGLVTTKNIPGLVVLMATAPNGVRHSISLRIV